MADDLGVETPTQPLSLAQIGDDPHNYIADASFERNDGSWPVPTNDGVEPDPAATIWTIQPNNAKVGKNSLRCANTVGGLKELYNANVFECSQGNRYQLRGFLKNVGGAAGTLGSAGLTIHFYDADMNELPGQVSVSVQGVQASFIHIRSGLIPAPPGTCFLRVTPFTLGQTAGFWYFDQTRALRGWDSEQLAPVGVNLLRDPGAEENPSENLPWNDGLTDQLPTGYSNQTTNVHSGTRSMKGTGSAIDGKKLYNDVLVRAYPGQRFYFEDFAMADNAAASRGVAHFGVEWLDSSQATLGADSEVVSTSGSAPTSYKRFNPSATIVAPAGAAYARYYRKVTGITAGSWYFDSPKFLVAIPGLAVDSSDDIRPQLVDAIRLLVENGSSAIPSIGFHNETNTGLALLSANEIHAIVNGSDRGYIGLNTLYFALLSAVLKNLSLTGTGGNGFLELAEQSVNPATPGNAVRLFADASNRLAWKGEDGFVRTFISALTADRTITLPDADVTLGFYGARVYNSTAIALANLAQTAITFDGERYDTSGFHSTSSNTSRLVAPSDGYYRISANASFASNATGYRQLALRINGATFIASSKMPAVNGAGTEVMVSAVYFLTAGDYVEIIPRQDSGGSLNIAALGNYSPEAWIEKVG